MKKSSIVFTVSISLFSIAPFANSGPDSKIEIDSISISNLQVKSVAEYWTEERMKNAIPLPTPEISEEEFKKLMVIPQEIKHGEIKTVEPSSEKLSAAPGEPSKANVKERPFWYGGKLFYTKPGGIDYVCSAQFVGTKRVLMTAAHCLQDHNSGAWYSNFKFLRAYDNGGGQSVGWKCGAVWSDWKTGSTSYNWRRDYAFLYASTDSGAGWLGLKTQIPYATWTAIGYPADYENGQYMYRVDGAKGEVANGTVEMKNNRMRGGSSGGAWIGDLTIPYARGNYAIGLNSFHTGSTSKSEFGPYFDNMTFSLYEYVRDQKCDQ